MDSKTPFHLSGSEVISGTEDKRPRIMTKKCFQCSYPSGNSEDLGIWEPKTVDKDQIYIFLIINYSVTIPSLDISTETGLASCIFKTFTCSKI